ncbi:MAG: tRNA (cytidine(34)-2'-O)-methyltransferase [Oligoflexia bacterium]|nr:tRNA (cytidine(34)-2'-O)-methyltransferase [Oligoflexia bacterium]
MPFHLNVVLVEPEIPQNTGSIGRLCLATGTTLHLVEPMAFEITHSRLKRAGLDYWEHLDVRTHKSLEAFLEFMPKDAPKVFFTKYGGKTLFQHTFEPGTFLFFGKETMGLPDWLTNRYASDCLRIPMYDARVRSLNLANAASIAVYEAIRQLECR